ncbi:outer membrane protein assembly factor BamD [bacterium]|jgi:outer membrane protein assembly factor BamD|nr:outer membrane protein assembly factor BamD [bacterium]
MSFLEPRARAGVTSILLIVVIALALGCSPIPEFGQTSAEDVYAIGQEARERGDYMVAIEAFKRVSMSWPLDELADDCLMGLGDAYLDMDDYASAEGEYLRLLSDYPRSDLVPEAEYKLGIVYFEQSKPAALDQATTDEAIEQFRRFLRTYPDGEFSDGARQRLEELISRLAQKDFETAMLYVKLGSPVAAEVYLKSIPLEYPDTPWAPRALLELVRNYVATGETAHAGETLRRLDESYPNTAEAEEAGNLLAEPGGSEE